jgi:hypothetical protein
MRKPQTVRALEELGRVQLSPNFFMRKFLHSEIAVMSGIANLPDDPDLALAAGSRLCEELLEPLQATFGRIALRSGFRSCAVNRYGNEHGFKCARNEADYAGHIWDRRDAGGHMGATACIVIPWFLDRYEPRADWRRLAWWIHDHLPYSALQFFPKLCAFNITWHERPQRRIDSFIAPKSCLTKPGMAGHDGDHGGEYAGFPRLHGSVLLRWRAAAGRSSDSA